MNNPFLNIIGSLLALSLASCNYSDHTNLPAIAAPPRWNFSSSATAWPDENWWRSFDSPELDALVAKVQNANPDIAASIARVHQATALARIAGAPLVPSLGLGADASRDSDNGSGTFGSSSGSFGDVTLTVGYEIDFWGKNHAALAAASHSLEASVFDKRVITLTTTAAAADAYFQILSLRERLALARANAANARQNLQQVEARAQAGTALAREVAQQRALVATQDASIPPLAQQETEAAAALALLLDKAPQSVSVSGRTLDHISVPAIGAGLPSELLARRPDIAEAKARLAAADANIAVAQAAMLPNVQLNGSVGLQVAAYTGATAGTGILYGIAAALTQPIFAGGSLAGQRDLTIAEKEELIANYHKAAVTAFSDVQKALGSVTRLTQQEGSQLTVVQESQRAVDLAQAEYRAGGGDLLTVLDVQRILYQAQDTLAQLKLARLEAAVTLFKALGGGWGRSL